MKIWTCQPVCRLCNTTSKASLVRAGLQEDLDVFLARCSPRVSDISLEGREGWGLGSKGHRVQPQQTVDDSEVF